MYIPCTAVTDEVPQIRTFASFVDDKKVREDDIVFLFKMATSVG